MSLDYCTQDKHGFTAPADLLGDVLSHTGNGKQYVITGFMWMGATDEWGYVHRAIGEHEPNIVRPLLHLCGKRKSGEWRYAEHLPDTEETA